MVQAWLLEDRKLLLRRRLINVSKRNWSALRLKIMLLQTNQKLFRLSRS